MGVGGEPIPGQGGGPEAGGVRQVRPEDIGVAVTDEEAVRRAAEATPVTKQQAEAKVREAQSAFTQLMNQMEASRRAQGDYFLKFGSNHPEGGPDGRALLLIEPSQNGEFVFISGNGPKIGEVTSDLQDFKGTLPVLKGLIEKGQDIPRARYEPGGVGRGQGASIEVNFGGPDYIKVTLGDLEDPAVLTDVMQRSIKTAEAPHRRNFERAQASIEMAHSLTDRINSLPPKE